MPVDLGTLPRVDPRKFGAVGGWDRRADRTVALSYTGALTQTACWEGRSQVCDEIRLTLAEVRRRTPWMFLRGAPGGRRQGSPYVRPRQALLLLLLLLTTGAQWAVHILQCTATPLGGVGQWKTAMHCLTA